jgi:hypothetical protein
VLDHSPFECAPSIADILQVSRSTVLKHLHDDIGFRCFYLHWVPHLLTPELKEQRRRYVREIIPVLQAATKDGWHHFVTENKSWFFLSYSPGRVWTLAKDNVVIKPGRDIQTAKFMFTVIWKPLGFHVIDRLPTGARMNSEYYTTNILARLEEKIFPNIPRGKNCACKKIDYSHGQLFDPHERSHRTLHEAKQYDEALTPSVFTRLGAERLLLVSKHERKVEKYSDGRRRRLIPSIAGTLESDSDQGIMQNVWRLD